MLPLQSPDAVQMSAFVVLHVSVAFAPKAIEVGDELNVTVGAGVGAGGDPPLTVTFTDVAVSPPGPEQVNPNVADEFKAPVASLPDVCFVPFHAPEAVHVVASVASQVSVVGCNASTATGLADKAMCGAADESGFPVALVSVVSGDKQPASSVAAKTTPAFFLNSERFAEARGAVEDIT